jgi:pimeloyl-ACP methyl ester carboxylesterase
MRIAGLVGMISVIAGTVAAGADPIVLRNMGSFYVGGRTVTLSGEPVHAVPLPGGQVQRVDHSGTYTVEQMYVQYALPQSRRGKFPLLMWHGGGLTGVSYETTPDGREGWFNMFVRKGWDVYVSDAVERGRAGWAMPEVFAGEPVFTAEQTPWVNFRFGEPSSWSPDPGARRPFAGSQFPYDAYADLLKEIVPRWLTTNDAIMRAYLELIDKVCPCVLLVHSQSGTFGFQAAAKRPDKIKALVVIEGTLRGDSATIAAVKNVPIAVIYGDNVDKSASFSEQRASNIKMAAAMKAAGGGIDIINLPEMGIEGNTHMMMMDKNNGEVANLIEDWLAAKGFVE